MALAMAHTTHSVKKAINRAKAQADARFRDALGYGSGRGGRKRTKRGRTGRRKRNASRMRRG